MVARILRGLWVVTLVACVAAAWGSNRLLGASLGPWAASLIGIGAVFALHPAAILLNFTLSRIFGDPVPKPSRLSAWRAVLAFDHEIDASMRGLWFATPFLAARAAPGPAADAPLQPMALLFVHGYFCNRAVWHAFMQDASRRGYRCEAVTLENPFAPIETHHRTIDHAIDALLQASDEAGSGPRRVVLVAHSMGGLVVRSALQDIDAGRVAHVITLGTPHHGTWTARFTRGPSVVQMRRDSAWLADLAAREALALGGLPRDRYTTLWSRHDDIVYPQGTAALEGAALRPVVGVGHVALLYDRAVRTIVFDRLAELRAQEVAGAAS